MREVERAAAPGPSAASAYSWMIELLEAVGSGRLGATSLWQCPGHDDSSPSLSVAEGRDGRVLMRCHAGCSLEQVLEALHVSNKHLFSRSMFAPAAHVELTHLRVSFPPIRVRGRRRGARHPDLRLDSIHPYTADVRLVRYRHGDGSKVLEWERRDRDGIWRAGLSGLRLSEFPLYEEHQIRMGAAAGESIVVVESESSVDALLRTGIYATTWAGGAPAPQLDRLAEVLAGARVVLVPDNDEAGLRCGIRIAAALVEAEAQVAIRVPSLPGQDARDLLVEAGPEAFRWVRPE